ncbi:MAG: hypothetical protein ABJH04_07620 [Cyclobacteriaceae bacterium]
MCGNCGAVQGFRKWWRVGHEERQREEMEMMERMIDDKISEMTEQALNNGALLNPTTVDSKIEAMVKERDAWNEASANKPKSKRKNISKSSTAKKGSKKRRKGIFARLLHYLKS